MQGKCIVVMGVSGSGKSTVAKAVAQKMNALFVEGDDVHPKENIEKMRNGIPLNDEDRQDWLEKINAIILQSVNEKKDCVISCSALKHRYREVLRTGVEHILFIYLKGSYELIHDWLEKRNNHFMSANLLQSQFADLEEPGKEEKDAVAINIQKDVDKEMNEIFKILREKHFIEN